MPRADLTDMTKAPDLATVLMKAADALFEAPCTFGRQQGCKPSDDYICGRCDAKAAVRNYVNEHASA